MTKVAIHQPNFFPWLGYFDKIARADCFVFLDNVQMPLTGSSYTNRVNILTGGKAHAIQVPTTRGMEARRYIATTPIAPQPKCREKLLRTIQQSYARAPFSEETLAIIEPLVLNPVQQLGSYNECAIRAIAAKVGISQSKFFRASDLGVAGSSNELLIQIVKSTGGSTYMAGGGAGEYQKDTAFTSAGLKVTYQDFKHPGYNQHNEGHFVPGLSIIDALMNIGKAGTRKLLGLP